MRRRVFLLLMGCLCAGVFTARAAEATRIIKVLPQLLDLQGRHALSPSLYDRDAYQFYLRQHTNEVSGIRFAVQWKAPHAKGPLTLRIEVRGPVRGDVPPQTTLETQVRAGGWFSHWAVLRLTGNAYRDFGEVTAWRATLWRGDTLLSEQHSFLW